MKFPFRSRLSRYAAVALAVALLGSLAASKLLAQAAPAKTDPAGALADALSAACRQDEISFASHLTTENAEAFRGLPTPRRTALIKRFVLLEDPGKPLLTTTNEGHPVMRCEAAGVLSEMRFGATEIHDNLAFIRVEVPQAGQSDQHQEAQNVRFGLVREGGQWKLLSVGMLLLDIPALRREWEHSDLASSEAGAVAALRKISSALALYQTAFGNLPEDLDQLVPPTDNGGFSPDKAGLIDNQLAAGESGGYRIRYAITPANEPGDDSDRDKAAGFSLAATPTEYGKGGQRSLLSRLQRGASEAAINTAPWRPSTIRKSAPIRSPKAADAALRKSFGSGRPVRDLRMSDLGFFSSFAIRRRLQRQIPLRRV